MWGLSRVRPARRRLAVAAGSAALVAAALAVVGAQTGAAGAATGSHARRADSAAARAIVSGDARFEVLSPTLIRMEYAGDGQFENAGTFNVIGRDDFAPTAYTRRVVNGWLTIRTSQATLRYQVGSGPFTAENVTMQLRTDGQTVTAHPTFQTAPSCTVGTLCEGEQAELANGVSVASDHSGYTGTGFAAGFTAAGATLTYQLDVPTDGTYDLRFRYANALGGDGEDTTRTLTAAVDGGTGQTVTLPTTASWDDWSVVDAGTFTLTAGTHTLVISRGTNDSGNVNIDSLAVTSPGAAYPTPSVTTSTCPYGTVCEAESGVLSGGASLATDHNGYSGGGFVAGLTNAGASETVSVSGVPADGTYALQIRYANADATPVRTGTVTVGDGTPSDVTFAPTTDWDTWSTLTTPVRLTKGEDTVVLGCPTADSCNVNLDTVAVAPLHSPVLLAHSPLGGYRRSLDGVDGSPVTTPGLLYRDGWTLLDDTASALYDPATQTVTQRPSHGGATYQDGYLFAYGSDYAKALADLKTLTGPTELLPRWAYGVWFSEYYDYSAADYENTILPTFRSQGVPLDVLVTDTDFKSPSTWDGWEMDPTKFPDPKAFFDWSASMGLHNTLNIHPSIVSNDPQFAQAEATSDNGLTEDSGAYVFDWGNPAQLKAYFDLHQNLEADGVDFWWLDWCCDNSYSSLPGVTPDAWINQQYADDTAKNIGRGFAFSRAYGSLQAGGYSGQQGLPTGPWADKRTTVHFTGDTTSDWQTLQFEVGYTPGESSSTGLSAVSDDIGGFNNDGTQTAGADPGSTKEADDLYVRWLQFGAFQPIMRLHGNHSDRLPWQYGDAARVAAEKFMNLRENLVPYTYTLARQATATGIPVVRPTYLQYPDQQAAYDHADTEYLYGPDVLVAPATSPGTTATTTVWFPPGSSWTDYFTGTTYAGGTTQQVSTDWNSMPVFVKSGGMVLTRTDDVTNDVQNPLTKATVTVAGGAPGSFTLYEDNGQTTNLSQSATTTMTYAEHGGQHQLTIAPARGSFAGQVTQRQWTVAFTDAAAPHAVQVNGVNPHDTSWSYDAGTRTLTVTVPSRSVRTATVVSYR